MDCPCSLDASYICLDIVSLSPACVLSLPDTVCIEAIIRCMVSMNCFTYPLITPISSLLLASIDTVKSPFVIAVITLISSLTGRITICTTRSTSTASTITDNRPIAIIMFRTLSISA